MTTEYKVIEDNYETGYDVEPEYDDSGEPEPYTGGYIAGTGTIVTEVTGDLAQRVHQRTGLHGPVTITERHWDSGYCVTCSYEEIEFTVQVNETTVYTTPESTGPTATEQLQGFAHFNEWLNNES
jgi:hypothetical protein